MCTDPQFRRLLVVGGDAANTRLKMSDSTGDIWRDSVELPYGPGITSFSSTLVQKDGRIYLTGGYKDAGETTTVPNAKNIYELAVNSRFKKVGQDEEDLAGVAGIAVPSPRQEY